MTNKFELLRFECIFGAFTHTIDLYGGLSDWKINNIHACDSQYDSIVDLFKSPFMV